MGRKEKNKYKEAEIMYECALEAAKSLCQVYDVLW